jgi:hypothetical protein
MRGKLAWLAGTWDVTMAMAMGVNEPSAQATGTQTHAWILNGHFLETQTQAQSAQGPIATRGLLTWDHQAQAYRHWSFNDLGEFRQYEGRWEDERTLIFRYEGAAGGRPFRQRITLSRPAEAEYRYVVETDRGSGFRVDIDMTGRKRAG